MLCYYMRVFSLVLMCSFMLYTTYDNKCQYCNQINNMYVSRNSDIMTWNLHVLLLLLLLLLLLYTVKVDICSREGLGDLCTVRLVRLIISSGPSPPLHAAQTANGTSPRKHCLVEPRALYLPAWMMETSHFCSC